VPKSLEDSWHCSGCPTLGTAVRARTLIVAVCSGKQYVRIVPIRTTASALHHYYQCSALVDVASVAPFHYMDGATDTTSLQRG